MGNKFKQNTQIYLLTSFFASLEFALPIYILFGKNYLGLSYTQIGLLTLIMYATSMIFDFAFGVVADAVSRKKIYIVGTLLSVLSVIPYLMTKEYIFFLASAVVAGLGIALTSNILDTVIHNNLTEAGELHAYPSLTSKSQQILFLGRASAGIIGGFLFSYSARLPYLAYMLALIICLILGFGIYEGKHEFKKTNFSETTHSILSFLGKRKDILYFCGIMFASLFFANLLFGYYQPYFNILKINAIVIGFLYSAISLVSAYGAHLMKKMLHTHTAKVINNYTIIGSIVTAILMMSGVTALALIGPLALGLVSGFMAPNLRYFLNSRSPTEIKTSIASFGTTFYTFAGMLGLSLAGVLADHGSPAFVFAIIIIGSLLVLLCNHFSLVNSKE